MGRLAWSDITFPYILSLAHDKTPDAVRRR